MRLTLATLAVVNLAFLRCVCSAAGVADLNIQWLTPSVEPGINREQLPTYNGSMPIGNGDLTALVWANASAGGINMYVGKQDAMSSNTELFRLAMVRLALAPNPIQPGAYFNHTLDLSTASMLVQAGGTADAPSVTFRVYADANNDVITIHASSGSGAEFIFTVDAVSVRPNSTWNYSIQHFCLPAASQPDVILQPSDVPPSLGFQSDTIGLYHRNNISLDGGSIINSTLTQQSLPQLVGTVHDWWDNRQYGIVIDSGDGPALQRTGPATLASSSPGSSFTVRISALSQQSASENSWIANLGQLVSSLPSDGERWAQHATWWSSFWARSYVYVNRSTWGTAADVNDTAYIVSQQYAVTRYVQAIQSRDTMWPIKFNGMAFTANVYDYKPGWADYRLWGPANWWQNTRLPYWPMLGSGDMDTFETILRYYWNMIPFASQRTLANFNHTGVYWTETTTVFGSHAPWDYGCEGKRPEGYPVWLETDDYIHLDYAGDGGTLEIALMVLDAYLYTGNLTMLQQYLPIATLAIDFYRQHYSNRTSDGKYLIWPTQTLETHQCQGWNTTTNQPNENCCQNDMPAVAGLHALLPKLLGLPFNVTTTDQRHQWTAMMALLPPIPMNDTGNGTLLAPAMVTSPKLTNDETPELYAVHPYRQYTIARNKTAGKDLSPAILSMLTDPRATYNGGWCQGGMNAALLGMTHLAAALVVQRAMQPPAAGYRFQGFASHEQDYEPSADHLANFMSALQWMLIQAVDYDDGSEFNTGTMVILPTWPCSWDVEFKLWGPMNTSVEVVFQNGQLVNQVVVPASRSGAVLVGGCSG